MTHSPIEEGDDPRSATTVPATPAGSSLRGRIGNVAAASAAALLLGQVVSMAQTVALARLLTPTQVGYFAAGSVVTSFISNVVEGGLRSGLVHREDRLEDAAETVFRATLAIGAVMSLLALASAPVVGMLFNSSTAGVVAASMSGGILLFSLVNVPEALLQRAFSVRRRLIVGPSVAIAFAVVSVTLAALGFGVWSLVIGTYASSAVWVLTLWLICDWRPGRGRADLAMYRELVGYGLPLAIATFADQTTRAIQAILTGRFLGVNSLGLFRYGERISQIPVGAIVEIGANSLFPAYSRISDDLVRFRRAYLNALGLVVAAAAAMSGMLVAFGEPLVVVVLGNDWRGAGVALVALAGVGLGVAMATSGEAIKGAGRTKLLNWLTGTNLVLGIGLVWLLAPHLGLVGVGLALSATALVDGTILVLMTRAVLRLPYGPVLRSILPAVASAAVAALLVRLLEDDVLRSDERGILLGLALLVLDGLVFTAVYAVTLRLVGPATFRLVLGTVRTLLRSLRSKLSSLRHS